MHLLYICIHLCRLPCLRIARISLDLKWNDFINLGNESLNFTSLQIVFFGLWVVLTSFSPCKIFESSHRWGPWRGAKGAPPKLLWCNRFGGEEKHIQPAMIGLGLAFQGLGSCLGNYLARFLSAIRVKESKENERCNLKTPRTSQPRTVCNWWVVFLLFLNMTPGAMISFLARRTCLF